MAVRKKTLVRAAILVLVLVWAGWHIWSGHRASRNAEQAAAHDRPASTASLAHAASVVSAPPATWTLGSVTFHACEIGGQAHGGRGASVGAWCNAFDVPEDRAHPQGRHIKLNLAIVRATSQKVDEDIVVILAGGPGEAATRAAHVATAFPELARHHDFLLMDQRGTGQSHPLDCHMQRKSLAGESDLQQTRRRVAACLAQVRKKADPRFYTTTAAVADLEAVRRALGSPSFDLIGVSYGTRVAQQYLMHHPQGVRSVILDSPVPNQAVLGQNMARHLQQALEKDFALCTGAAACKKRFGDPMQSLTMLAAALEANPHKVSTRDPRTFRPEHQVLDRQTLVQVVRFFAYTRMGITLLPLTIDTAAHGDVGPLLGQYQWMFGHGGGVDMDVDMGMNWSVICSEDADLMRSRKADAATLLGNAVIRKYKAICAVWPHGTRPADFHQPLKSDKPVLILSGALDPVTPPVYGKTILKGLTHGRQLIVRGQGHGTWGVECMPHLMYQFVKTLKPKQLDASCLKRQGPVHPFLTFNGARP